MTVAWLDDEPTEGAAATTGSLPPGWENDVRIDFYRGSGAGGQHRNKVESCVRATHTITGLTVVATEQRSKHQNLAVAWARIEAALRHQADSASRDAINAERLDSIGEGRAWLWVGWRDSVTAPDGRKASMKKALAGRLGGLLD